MPVDGDTYHACYFTNPAMNEQIRRNYEREGGPPLHTNPSTDTGATGRDFIIIVIIFLLIAAAVVRLS